MIKAESSIATQTFIIPGTLPGLNEMLNAAKTKLRSRSRSIKTARGTKYELLKREAGKAVFVAIREGRIAPMMWTTITIHWYEPNKKRDPDGFCSAGRKVIHDALVETGVLANDGWRYVKPPFTDHWSHDTLNPRIVVTLEGPLRKEE